MPSSRAPEHLLEEARAVFANDPERARELRQEVTQTEISPAWSEAHTDLATYEHGQGNYEPAAKHATAVLSAPIDRVSLSARAVAGVVLADCLDFMGIEPDLEQLQPSVESALQNGQPYYAGAGLSQLARFRGLAGDRAGERAFLERAVTAFDKSGSMIGGPRALYRLAKLAIEEQRIEEARGLIDRVLTAERFRRDLTSTRLRPPAA